MDRVEARHRIDLRSFLKRKRSGRGATVREVAWIAFNEKTGVALIRSLVAPAGRTRLVRIRTDRPTFGGERRWAECPDCQRRCASLYLPEISCRLCCKLRYSSQAESPSARKYRAAVVTRRRLRSSSTPIDPLPSRPKWMHFDRYARLVQECMRADEAWFATTMARTEALEKMRAAAGE